MSILGCEECAHQVDTDFDSETLIEDDVHGVLCPDCADKFGVYHPMGDIGYATDEDIAAVEADAKVRVESIDCTPTWEGLIPLYLEVLVNQGAHCHLRSEFVKMAQAADKWNAHCKVENDRAADSGQYTGMGAG